MMEYRRFTHEDAGFSSVVPEGWAEQETGQFVRGASETDPTFLVLAGAAGFTVDDLIEMLLPQLKLEALPERADRIQTTNLSWDLYITEHHDHPVAGKMTGDLAFAQGDKGAYVVLLGAAPGEYPDLHAAVFLPAIKALAPLTPDPEIEAHVEEYYAMVWANRDALRNGPWPDFPTQSDQKRGVPMPPPQQPYDTNAPTIDLPAPDPAILTKPNLYACIADRVSHRKYTDESLTLQELAYLLWATQGVRKVVMGGRVSFRTVPSGGGRHPFETTLAVNRVQGVAPGVYLYLPFEHKLVHLFAKENLAETLGKLANDQRFVGQAAVCLIWSAVPYRQEWRYGTQGAKGVLLDAGHVCQNLYLACESIGCGTCAIAAYRQEDFDRFLGLDGEDELVVYLAPVGKVDGA
jgi:SagB-type dehydrogenase family enzyme